MKMFSVGGGCAGKTEVVRRLVAELAGRGLRVSTVRRVPDAVTANEPVDAPVPFLPLADIGALADFDCCTR
jgi:molybdopterin-guanine dinucleotide biosynthesis protein